ncbi:LCP family protein [Streptomyces natalensis]|uniref:LCP family protein n=1 Tax=Streptomyces natalensis TaxID=68242 RepID=UPI0005CB7329|nr:LCP family protein [Streptomyces natalensis]
MNAPSRSQAPTPRRTARPTGRRRPPRTRWGLRISAVAAGVLLAAGGFGHAMVAGVETRIGRVDPFKDMPTEERPGGGSGLNFLVVGTDGRDKITKEEKRAYHLGGVPCHCTDTLMLVHLSAERDRASIISLPRDSYAEVPAHQDPVTGRRHPRHPVKLNAAYAEGGPNLTVRTVEHMTGVHIDHYLEVDFTSFMHSVDAVGGVEVCTSRPLRDSFTGLDLPAGKHLLGGGQALQYVRSRHIDASADLGRMHRQQRFLASLIHKITSSGVLMNPIRFKDVAETMLESVRADSGFAANDLVDLGQAMRGFTPSSSEFVSVPLTKENLRLPGGGEAVRWDPVASQQLFQAIRDDRPLARHPGKDAPEPQDTQDAQDSPGAKDPKAPQDARQPSGTEVEVPPSQITVRVDNGTLRAGLGATAAKALRATGFRTSGTPGTTAGRHPAAHTVIDYDPRWNRSARALAAALPGARLHPVVRRGPVLHVTLGADFTAVTPVREQQQPPQPPAGVGAITGDQAVCP